jgi:outer membrane receptor protein involved in Fe transport
MCLLLGALLALVAAPPVLAQETRGSISGTVKDNSGGALPGVTVTATQKVTNRATSAVTNEAGSFNLLFLQPGVYTVSAELSGFKKTVRDNVEVRVNDRIGIDLAMEIGGLEETVTVLAETPLLETRSASQGQIIDEKRISLLPLSDGNPFVLTRLAPGIAYTGDLKFSRPFDNGGTSAVVADGAPGANEFTLDGSPNMASGGRVAYVPPSDAVQEFKVESATFDAQQGHTAGATVNVAIKSGTNNFRGTGYVFYRDEKLSANEYFLEKAGKPKSLMDYTRWGATAGGPIRKDKTFFFGVFERLDDAFPEVGQYTVPTAAQLNGDFSALLSQGIIIYDPATAFLNAAGRVERLPFPGNVIPANRISPISQNYLKYYPAANQAGDAQGRNNYLSENTRSDDFYAVTLRGDHQLTANQRVFVRWSKNDRREARGNWTGEVNGVKPIGNYLFRKNDQVTIDHVWTMSSGMLLNLRGGYALFREPSVRQHEGVVDPATIGWSTGVVQLFNGAKYMPRFEIGGTSVIGENLSGPTDHGIWSFQPTWTKASGSHNFRVGWDYRAYQEYSASFGAQAGRYDFNSDYTRQFDNSPAAAIGQQLAAMMLGQTTGGLIDRNADRYNQTVYNGVFFQDDWRVTDKLTLNLGLRYELEGATTERDNRNVLGFDPGAALTITGPAQAAYAANPIPEVSPSAFKVLGGLGFADDSNRGFYAADKNNWQPRLGMAYSLDSKTVLRAGYAMYAVPAVINGVRQSGFSQATNIVPSSNVGLTFQATLANPFPAGVAGPPGASLGPNTFVGRQLDRWERDAGAFQNAQAMRWSVSVQRELPHQWVVEAGYVGNHGYDLAVDTEFNPVPRSYLSTSQVRDQTTINYLTANVTNPFRDLLPGTSFNGSTVQRLQLLRPYPQLANIQSRAHDGTSDYQALQSRVEKRFTAGYTILAAYTWSKFTEQVSQLNATDAEYEERPSSADIPHRLVVSGIYELPFGRSKKWGADWNRAINAVAGGWSIQAIYQWQTGRPVTGWGNRYYNADVNGLKADYSKVKDGLPIFDTTGFYFSDAAVQTNGVVDPAKQRADTRIRLDQNIRYFPTQFWSMRQQALSLMDMSFVKRFQFTGRVRGQLHIELLNAFDQAFFNIPNLDPTSSDFGKVTDTQNLPLNVQLAFKIIF